MPAPIRLALYQPDIPQNAGAILRLAACFGVRVHIIEPCGFVLDDRRMRRAGMDYLDKAALIRHSGWAAFVAADPGRLVLATTRAATRLDEFAFAEGDCLLFGRESAGVPDEVHASAHARIRIPMRPGLRSINVAQAAAILTSEALRQLAAFPADTADTGPDPR